MRQSFLMLAFTIMSIVMASETERAYPSSGSPDSKTDPPVLILSVERVLEMVEEGHPLLNGSRTEKMRAKGQLLKALGAFEPAFVNDWELERRVSNGQTESVGFNDTLFEVRHPWGIQGFAGFRWGLGPVEVADLAVNETNQPLLGIALPLLRGFRTNPEHAELKKSRLADRQALLEIDQTRQDLYLGAATQFWNWVASWKSVELRQQALRVATVRYRQLSKQAQAGAVAPFDVTEANQELQRRLNNVLAAKRNVEQEQIKLALFLWKENTPLDLTHYGPPDFTPIGSGIPPEQIELDKLDAIQWRPEPALVELEAERNHIDLDVAKNNLLPELQADAEPTRKPGEFVLGLGYRFGAMFKFPFLQQGARGEALQIEGKGKKLKFLQQYRIQQVALDVDNAYSAMDRARQRVTVSNQALELARQLEKGERKRFKLGATSLIFVNLRERNVVKAGTDLIKAQAEYFKAQALHRWATGAWVKELSSKDNDS